MVKKYKTVIIMGPQASGKGTQAKCLAEKLGITHVSIGRVFRQEVRSGSKLGALLKEYMDRGELIPHDLNDKLVSQVLKEHPDGILLDGYPRNKLQSEFLDAHLTVDLVLVLQVPDVVCIDRISGRRVCDNGHNYHVEFIKPKVDGVCDVDGLPLHMRDDDKPEAVKKRLGIYHGQSEPVIAHYRQKGVVVEVDGSPSIEDVRTAITLKLNLP